MTFQFWDRIRDLWHNFTASRYVQALESEVARLRAENRALMNSILGIAGVPPVITTGDSREEAGTTATKVNGAATATSTATNAVPLRRRSWQQVNRALEIESAKKKEPGSAS